jgi:hypothetical protein
MAQPAKNSSDPITVSAIDPRNAFNAQLDDTIMQLESRNRSLAAQRKQLDLETQANDDTIRAAILAISELDTSIARARELSLTEEA